MSLRFGRYVLEQRLAVGGMAEIFLARSEGPAGFAKRVVIKRILPSFQDHPDFVRMFLDEARVGSSFNHPNLLHVYDLVEDQGQYAIVMELIEGENLAVIIDTCRRKGVRVPYDVAVHIVASAADGLHHAHELLDETGEPLNLVHRDVSPSNIIVTAIGGIKVVDFGIAKSAASRSSTQAGVVKGKFVYMSPEQGRGAKVDRRTDLFSLGSTLYELLTLERCFDRHDTRMTLEAILTGDYVPLTVRRSDSPAALVEVIGRMLAVEPSARFDSAASAATALRRSVHAPIDTAEKRIREFLVQIGETADRRDFTLFTSINDAPVSADDPLSRPEVPFTQGQRPAPEAEEIDNPTELGTMPLAPVNPEDDERTLRVLTPVSSQPESALRRSGSVSAGQLRRPSLPLLAVAVGVFAVAVVVAAGVGRLRKDAKRGRPSVGLSPAAADLGPLPTPTVGDFPVSAPSLPAPTPGTRPASTATQTERRPGAPAEIRRERPAPRRTPPVSAQLTLESVPRAHVYLDERRIGTTPLVDLDLKPGRHDVVLRPVQAGGSKTVHFDLRPGEHKYSAVAFDSGKIVVHVTPWGRVTVDGEPIGVTPLAPLAVLEGSHEISVTNPEKNATKTVNVIVEPNRTARVVIEF
jgi:serine/threonine-protein kinase